MNEQKETPDSGKIGGLSGTPGSARSCNDCQHCLMRGELITCGMLLAEIAGDAEEGEEIDTELADGIHHTFAEGCSDFLPNK